MTGNGASSLTTIRGGGVLIGSGADMLLTRSLVARNTITAMGSAEADGAGVYVAGGGSLTAVATTVAENIAAHDDSSAFGGGIFVANTGTVTLRHVTVAGNRAGGGGPAIYNSGKVTIGDSIVGRSAGFGNCAGVLPVARGRNIDWTTSCGFGAGHLNSTDPQLLPLGDHGGPTDSMSLPLGSPAHDAAAACPDDGRDQRGAPAPVGVRCDIGAAELSSDLTVTAQGAQDALQPGAGGTYILRITNNGPDPAPATVLDVTMGGATPTLAPPSAGTCTLVVRCQIGTLARDQGATVTIVARAGDTPVTLSASVESASPDPAPADRADLPALDRQRRPERPRAGVRRRRGPPHHPPRPARPLDQLVLGGWGAAPADPGDGRPRGQHDHAGYLHGPDR